MSLNPSLNETRERLREIILNYGLKWDEGINPNGYVPKWIFDLREIILTPEGAKLAAKLIYDKIKDLDFDAIGGPSLAAEPLVASLLMYAYNQNKNICGFIVRKEPNNFGLRKKVEGPIKTNQKVVLVDDALNTGRGMLDAVESINKQGCQIVKIVTLLDFLKAGHDKFLEQGYHVDYIYSLEDFNLELNEAYEYGEIKELTEVQDNNIQILNEIKGSLNDEIIDSQLHGNLLVVALKNGSVWCFDRETSIVKWHLDLGESIFAPMLIDGNTAVVSASSGLKRSLLFSIDIDDGKVINYVRIKGVLYSAPAIYEESYLIGSDDKKLYCIDKKNLETIWNFQTGGAIKLKPIFDNHAIYLCSNDGFIYALNFDGELKWKKNCGKIDVLPVVFEDRIMLKSESDVVFCLNKHNGTLNWFFQLKNKAFDVKIFNSSIVVGGLLGYLFFLDIDSGKVRKTLKISNENIKKIEASDDKLLVGFENGKSYNVRIT